MVQKTITPRDIELLCAYLDNELRPAERARLETRLQSEPTLTKEMEGLRRTRAMLRSLPLRRAPRNFTLTPAMVGATRRHSWQPVFGMASALAVVLLVLVLLSDFIFIPGYVGMFAVSQAPSAEESTDLAQKEGFEAASDAAAEEALIFPTEVPADMLAGTPTAQPPSMKAFPADQLTPTPQGTSEAAVMADSLPESSAEERAILGSGPETTAEMPMTEGLQAPSPGVSSTPALAESQTITGTLTVQELPAEALAEKSQMEAEAENAAPAGLMTPVEPEQQPEPQGRMMWLQVVFWMVELLLACLAVAAGLISFYLWYTSRQ